MKTSGFSQTRYERDEAQHLYVQLQRVEKAPLADRKAATKEFFEMLRMAPGLLEDRLHWLRAGNYGFGAMQRANAIAAAKRGNREAQLFQLLATLEWNVPAAGAREAWNRLSPAQQARVQRLVRENLASKNYGPNPPGKIRAYQGNPPFPAEPPQLRPAVNPVRRGVKTVNGMKVRPNAEHQGYWDVLEERGGRLTGKSTFTGTLKEIKAIEWRKYVDNPGQVPDGGAALRTDLRAQYGANPKGGKRVLIKRTKDGKFLAPGGKYVVGRTGALVVKWADLPRYLKLGETHNLVEYLENPAAPPMTGVQAYVGNPSGVSLKDVYQNDDNLRRAFSWLTKIGAAPAFGSRPIHWYQLHQTAAIDILKRLAGDAPLRSARGLVQMHDGVSWKKVISTRELFDQADKQSRS